MPAITNEEHSAQEVTDFVREQPGAYFAYHQAKPSGFDPITRLHHGDSIVTWMGDQLARVTEAHQPYRAGFNGGIRQNFRALGINGVTYAGTAYLSSGDYVRMRAVKP